MSSALPSAISPAKLEPTPRSTPRRRAARGSHERALIDAIIDEALVCHLGVSLEDGPHVLPTAHVRVGDQLYFHGARKNHLLCAAASGTPLCVTITLLDGLVFSREAFHHSMNYRSVVLFGRGSEVTDPEEKLGALRALVEHTAAGRWQEVLPPSAEELAATLVVSLPITEGSAKQRRGPPLDGAHVASHLAWAGELPLRLVAEPPRADTLVQPAVELSPALRTRTTQLGLGWRTPYERRVDDLLISTDQTRLDQTLVHRFLHDESYWAKGVSQEAFQHSCAESLCFGIYRSGQQLGFARVVSDFSRFAYLADVFVVAAERGRGLGKLLVGEIFAHPALTNIERWLLGTADAHGLYAQFGFAEAPQGRYMVRRR